MTTPDFQISVRLRAQKLVSHVSPAADVNTEGENVMLTQRRTRRGVAARPPGDDGDVSVGKQIDGRVAADRDRIR
jgi:hypothetical protein